MTASSKTQERKHLKSLFLEEMNADLSTRLLNSLLGAGLRTPADVRAAFESRQSKDWLALPQFGQGSLTELQAVFGVAPEAGTAALSPSAIEKQHAQQMGVLMARAFAHELLRLTRGGAIDETALD